MLSMQFMESTGCARLRSVAGSLICSTSTRATWFQRARFQNPNRFPDDIVRLIPTEEVFSHSAEKPMFLDRIKSLDRDGSGPAALDRPV